jgi:alpha,alpha-trehalase
MNSQERLERAISIASDPFSEPEVYYGEPNALHDGPPGHHHRRTFSAVSDDSKTEVTFY